MSEEQHTEWAFLQCDGKNWKFVDWVPKKERLPTEFERVMEEHRQELYERW